MKITGIALAVVAATALAAQGCIVEHHHRHWGAASEPAVAKRGPPPPHAPAHGYRHKHRDGVTLSFDTGTGVYLVVGHAAHYFYSGHYYRRSGTRWLVSPRFSGPWAAIQVGSLPRGLREDAGPKTIEPPSHPGKLKRKGLKR